MEAMRQRTRMKGGAAECCKSQRGNLLSVDDKQQLGMHKAAAFEKGEGKGKERKREGISIAILLMSNKPINDSS
ncbi:hypothetical protein E2C01_000626 [Portunus trituberculatus]|uniref:Uncharacterized protein n=1 Tax=Portunus trituberculatus TaxID=210409 RepID=A0A5B7CFK0_PORTR|nr:hypothetical protein [Portunus trituberculatus]